MSWSYYIYSSLTYAEIQKLEEAYTEAFSQFLETNPEILDCEEGTGLVFAEKEVPTTDKVKDTYADFEMEIPPGIIERLGKCVSAIQIESPVRPEKSRLQVSTLVYLLERSGTTLFDWGDFQLQLGEHALANLRKLKHFGVMGAEDNLETEEEEEAPKGPGVERAEHFLHLFHAAEDNRDLAIDLERMIKRQPEPVQRYLAYVIRDGAMNDKDAAQKMGMKEAELRKLLKPLEERLDDFGDEDDDEY